MPVSMKFARTVKLVRAMDRDNPRRSEKMSGPPIVRKGRGLQKTPARAPTSMRLAFEVLAFFGSQGAGYQNRINQVLKEFVASRPIPRSTGRAAKAPRAG